jgi:hypothetical protein
MKYKIGNLQIAAPPGWLDVTNETGEVNAPFTLARSDGVGAIQFSTAEYKSGRLPMITGDSLQELMEDFVRLHEVGRGFAAQSRTQPLLSYAQSFEVGSKFLRVWYCSNGRDVALVTYVCERGAEQTELPDCETIVRNLEFIDGLPR